MAEVKLNLYPNVDGTCTFFPGDTIKEFYIHIFGEATANWSSRSCDTTTYYTGKEPLLDFKFTVLGKHKGPKFILESGVYKCHYTFKLPDNIPYSLVISGGQFSSKSGTINYHVEAVLVMSWLNIGDRVGFTVIREDDLNLYPELKLPLKSVQNKIFSFFFKKDEILRMSVSIPYSGFTVNQRIPITIEYKNESTVDIHHTDIRFIQVLTLVLPREGNPKKKKKEMVISSESTAGVLANSSKTIKTELVVPKVFKSNDKFCMVVSINYLIEVVADVKSGCHLNKKIRFPITIGNVPIRTNDQVRSYDTYRPRGIAYNNDSPPSFDEALNFVR
ncbi:uncharacterized protein [Chironomus tepperi]|uniref:uncharacterized protein n=1 Tax=Chironomus tepperi TaxID=113505 RepID=UPI00391F3761